MVYLLIGIGVIVLAAILINNSLVGRKNQVENSFAGIDAQLKKRFDLLPNLVETVKQYMGHEKTLLTEVTELRAKAQSGTMSDDDKVNLDNKVSKVMSGIMVAVENYPDLKASDNFLQLQRTMNEIEEQLSAARRAYNASVTDYNNAIEMFPSNIIANMKSYKRKLVFEATVEERENVNVKSLFNS